MKVHIPKHAEYRLIERGIDIDKIKQTIHSPDKRVPQFNGRTKVEKKLQEGQKLYVIYIEEKNKFVIITAYYEN